MSSSSPLGHPWSPPLSLLWCRQTAADALKRTLTFSAPRAMPSASRLDSHHSTPLSPLPGCQPWDPQQSGASRAVLLRGHCPRNPHGQSMMTLLEPSCHLTLRTGSVTTCNGGVYRNRYNMQRKCNGGVYRNRYNVQRKCNGGCTGTATTCNGSVTGGVPEPLQRATEV